jgi:transposase, IS6 family
VLLSQRRDRAAARRFFTRAGLKRHRSARILAAGHAFAQNLRRGHYKLATDVPARHRIRTAFDQLTMAI